MKDRTIIILFAMMCITVVQMVNMITVQIDGVVTNLVIATIGGLAGYNLKYVKGGEKK